MKFNFSCYLRWRAERIICLKQPTFEMTDSRLFPAWLKYTFSWYEREISTYTVVFRSWSYVRSGFSSSDVWLIIIWNREKRLYRIKPLRRNTGRCVRAEVGTTTKGLHLLWLSDCSFDCRFKTLRLLTYHSVCLADSLFIQFVLSWFFFIISIC